MKKFFLFFVISAVLAVTFTVEFGDTCARVDFNKLNAVSVDNVVSVDNSLSAELTEYNMMTSTSLPTRAHTTLFKTAVFFSSNVATNIVHGDHLNNKDVSAFYKRGGAFIFVLNENGILPWHHNDESQEFMVVEYQALGETSGELLDLSPSQILDEDSEYNGGYAISIPFDELGLYTVRVYTRAVGASEYFRNVYSVACLSSEPVFVADFGAVGARFDEVPEQGIEFTLTQINSGYYGEAYIDETFSGEIVFRDADNNEVNQFNAVVTGKNKIKVMLTDPSKKVVPGQYTINFPLDYVFTSVLPSGLNSTTSVLTSDVSLQFRILEPRDNSFPFLTVILSLLILGGIGGVLLLASWGINKMQQQSNLVVRDAPQVKNTSDKEVLRSEFKQMRKKTRKK